MTPAKIALIPRKSGSVEVYRQLEFVLKELKSFFICDGNGVPAEDLETNTYKVGALKKMNTLLYSLFLY